MKKNAKILFISMAVLYGLLMVVMVGLLVQAGSADAVPLVKSETVYTMMGLWLTLPLGLMGLTLAMILTVQPRGRSIREVKVAAYLSGAFVIGAALVLVIFLIMTGAQLLHPRQSQLILTTADLIHTYDGTQKTGTAPELSFGQLYDGHRLEVQRIPEYSQVGEYLNAPEYRIVDENGVDITDQYDIREKFGKFQIEPKKVTVSSPKKSKVYDGTPLNADPVTLTGGSLVQGHTLSVEGSNSLTLPGTEPIRPVYRILAEDGTDVTAQYAVTEDVGTLTVMPVDITITTDSKTKIYDGKSLSASGWEHISGKLLKGHSLQMQVTAVLKDVGTIDNEGVAQILDAEGKDVTALYSIHYQFGSLKIQPIALYVTTDSAQKVYDGKALAAGGWKLTRGNLEEGCTVKAKKYPTQTQVGTLENAIEFSVVNAKGEDVSHRYVFVGDYGTLTVQPRAITLRTDSAQKVYDGKALSCNTFQIVSGSLLDDDWVEIVGVSITEVGMSENYVLDCTVYRKDAQGNVTDVSACYRISFDFGVLKITAK